MYSSIGPRPFFVFLIYLLVLSIEQSSCLRVYNLNETTINGLEVIDKQIVVCKSSQEKRFLNLFAKSYLEFNDVNAIKGVHSGYSVDEVVEQMDKWFNYNYLRTFINSSTINLPLYTDYCVGIEASKGYRLTFHFNSFDFYNFLLFIIGVTLFYTSNYLSKKIYIYYASHVLLGVLGSLSVLTIIMHRFLPRRLYAFFVLSSFYLNTYFVVKIKEYLFTYPFGLYLMCYILVAAILSFAFAYYKGPIKNHRLFDLFKWFLQFISLIIIFISSEHSQLIGLIMALILLKYNSPAISHFKTDLAKSYRSYFPKPRRLLTLDEYEKEGQIYTERELEKLRDYCKSPQFNKWKAMKKMRNASRFASFVDDGDHVSDDEIFEHISHVSFSNESQWTDDESDQSIGIDDSIGFNG